MNLLFTTLKYSFLCIVIRDNVCFKQCFLITRVDNKNAR